MSAEYYYASLVERLRKLTPIERAESLKQILEWFIEAENQAPAQPPPKPRKKKQGKPHRYNKPVLTVIEGGHHG